MRVNPLKNHWEHNRLPPTLIMARHLKRSARGASIENDTVVEPHPFGLADERRLSRHLGTAIKFKPKLAPNASNISRAEQINPRAHKHTPECEKCPFGGVHPKSDRPPTVRNEYWLATKDDFEVTESGTVRLLPIYYTGRLCIHYIRTEQLTTTRIFGSQRDWSTIVAVKKKVVNSEYFFHWWNVLCFYLNCFSFNKN